MKLRRKPVRWDVKKYFYSIKVLNERNELNFETECGLNTEILKVV